MGNIGFNKEQVRREIERKPVEEKKPEPAEDDGNKVERREVRASTQMKPVNPKKVKK